MKLVSHFVSNEQTHQKDRDKFPDLLPRGTRKTFGWPIGLSYAGLVKPSSPSKALGMVRYAGNRAETERRTLLLILVSKL